MSTVTIYADKDAYLNQNSPTVNYGDEDNVRIGDQIDTAIRDSNGVLHFNITGVIPFEANIVSATLKMYLLEKEWSGETTANMHCYPLLVSFDEDLTTWNLRTTGSSWEDGGALGTTYDIGTEICTHVRRSTDATGTWHTIGSAGDFTTYVQDIVNYTSGSGVNGLMLSGNAPGIASRKNSHRYASKDYSDGTFAAKLEVEYIEDGLPTVTTSDASITIGTVSITGIDGEVTDNGGDEITEQGICYSSTNSTPLTSSGKVTGSLVAPTFTVDLTGLTPGTKYYYRAYATNTVGTSYGSTVYDDTTIAITRQSGDGGIGVKNSITGEEEEYGGGGGGAGAVTGSHGVGTYGGGTGGSPTLTATNGTDGTGGGGGGAYTATGAGAGGKGIVIVKYAVADAISATPELSSSLFRPSIAYHNGKLFAPYSESSGLTTKDITAASVETGVHTHITCTGHGMATGQVCIISNSSGFAPSLDGVHVATRIDDNTFSIDDVDITDGTGTATLTYNHSVGYTYTDSGYNTGYLYTSDSSFHTGSMLKEFKYVSITHEPLPEGATITIATVIDNVRSPVSTSEWTSPTASSSTTTESRFDVATMGKHISLQVKVTPDTSLSITPVITGINVVWDFKRIPKHLYSLDCREGAGGGRWKGDPEAAIEFLFSHATSELDVEDRFSGEYVGTIENIEYQQSNRSLEEGPSGLVKLLVREVS